MTEIPVFAALPGGFGAECAAFDLERPLGAEARRAISAAFLKYRLLVFRSQRLSADHMRAFAAAFGEVEGNIFRKPDGSTLEDVHVISNLGANGLPDEDSYIKSNYNWHTDKSYLPVPALLTMLQAIELPPRGGDTEFADMTRACEALPAQLRQRIDGLRAVHSFEYMRCSTNDRPLTEAERAATPPVVHPLVRTHPETGEKSLYLGMYCSHIRRHGRNGGARADQAAPGARHLGAVRVLASLAAGRSRLLDIAACSIAPRWASMRRSIAGSCSVPSSGELVPSDAGIETRSARGERRRTIPATAGQSMGENAA